MKIKILTGIALFLLTSNFILAKIPQEHPGSFCDFPSDKIRKDVINFLSKAYDDAVKSILNGRNGRKLKQCKIDEIKKILPNLIFEYTCTSGNGNCAQGGPKHDMLGIPHILIFDPIEKFLNKQKNLDIPPVDPCGCSCPTPSVHSI